ncbi:MAG: NeuD/PglB/VioB family sugar acetyltransferase [Lachnospiraceae bacterium]|nr:NeuD/PglB/VioB family sugar acetyltransferase [Lachnospiraceae bacterium]
MDDIILIGFGGHAKSVVDSIERQGLYRIAGFTEREGFTEQTYKHYKVIGTDADLPHLYEQGIRHAFVTVGYMGRSEVRRKLYEEIKKIGFAVPNIIDDTAVLAGDVKLGEGIFVGKRAVVNANASIGDMCIINTAAVLEHDCEIGGFSHVAVGAVLCGGCKTGKSVFIGANATVVQQLEIADNSFIKAGQVVASSMI